MITAAAPLISPSMNYTSESTVSWLAFDNHIHPSSRVPASRHHPALVEMLSLQLSMELVDYIVDYVIYVVNSVLGTPSSSMGFLNMKQPSLVFFVTNVIFKSRATMGTILVALAYLDKAQGRMKLNLGHLICERVFLGAFLVAHKYTNDSWMRAQTWADFTGVLKRADVVRVEREFLHVLDFRLHVDENALLVHHGAMMSRCAPYRIASVSLPNPNVKGINISLTNPNKSWRPAQIMGSQSPLQEDWCWSSSLDSVSPPDSPSLLTPRTDLNTTFCLPVPKAGITDSRIAKTPAYYLAKSEDGWNIHTADPPSLGPEVDAFIDEQCRRSRDGQKHPLYDAHQSYQPSLLAELQDPNIEPYCRNLPHIAEVIPPYLLHPSPNIHPSCLPPSPFSQISWMLQNHPETCSLGSDLTYPRYS